MCNLIIQNPIARGKRGRGKGKGGYGRLAYHMAWLKVAHRVNATKIWLYRPNTDIAVRAGVITDFQLWGTGNGKNLCARSCK